MAVSWGWTFRWRSAVFSRFAYLFGQIVVTSQMWRWTRCVKPWEWCWRWTRPGSTPGSHSSTCRRTRVSTCSGGRTRTDCGIPRSSSSTSTQATIRRIETRCSKLCETQQYLRRYWTTLKSSRDLSMQLFDKWNTHMIGGTCGFANLKFTVALDCTGVFSTCVCTLSTFRIASWCSNTLNTTCILWSSCLSELVMWESQTNWWSTSWTQCTSAPIKIDQACQIL